MIRDDTLYGFIQEIVRKETMFYKHYAGNVLDNADSENLGRVQVSIPLLNITTQDIAPWAWPRDKQSMNVPAIGDWVEIYFIDANPDKACYLGLMPEMTQAISATTFDGQPSTHVIFESPATQESINYDDVKKELDILVSKLIIMGGTEPFVLGTQLNTFLGKLETWLDAHQHTYINAGGAPTATTAAIPPNPSPSVSGILSAVIMGK